MYHIHNLGLLLYQITQIKHTEEKNICNYFSILKHKIIIKITLENQEKYVKNQEFGKSR